MSEEQVRILLIEDNPADVRLLRELVRDGDPLLPRLQLDVATTLAEGLARLVDHTFDVVLLDLSLPDSQGMESFTRIQAATPETPILVLSGLADAQLALASVQAGAQDYLVKGRVNGPALLRATRYAIERRRAQRVQEDLLRQQSRLEGVLLAARELAHRINNDIQLAVGSLSLLEEQEGLSPELRELIADSLQRVLHLAEHVHLLQSAIRAQARSTPAGPSLDVPRSLES
ncbi:MAG: hypothetical protein KatS3mg061_1326 [Dehalococcoidia bacterium]|nr:MAG: hypothetical protein KatS3mg061_1326 [Dehalococcoidia bacterium]